MGRGGGGIFGGMGASVGSKCASISLTSPPFSFLSGSLFANGGWVDGKMGFE